MSTLLDSTEEKASTSRTNALIIIGLIVILSVALFVFIPYYFARIRTTLVKEEILNIYAAALHAQEVNAGFWAEEVWQLVDYGYLEINDRIAEKWDFHIDSKEKISAISNDLMKGGANKEVVFIIAEDAFYGYGTSSNGEHGRWQERLEEMQE
ncbi:hypothetical protein K8I28_03925 [bacterium]|nr:hypothetical protein [bacterium]